MKTTLLRFALIAIFGVLISQGALAELKVGDTFPELKGFHFEGKLPDSIKGKTVLVDFWASWCAPCQESFPALNEIFKKYSDKGLVIIGVSLDETKSDMDYFLKENPAAFVIVRDTSEKLAKKLGLRTFPSSFILDGDGKIRFSHTGFHGDKTKKEYMQEIESILSK